MAMFVTGEAETREENAGTPAGQSERHVAVECILHARGSKPHWLCH